MNRRQRRSAKTDSKLHPDALLELRRREAGGPHLRPSSPEPLAAWLTLDEMALAVRICEEIEAGRMRLSEEHARGLFNADGTGIWDTEGRVTDALRRYFRAKSEPGWPYIAAVPTTGDA